MKLITRFTFIRIFSIQSLVAAISAPVFVAMYRDFGAHPSWMSKFVIATWPYWALVATAMLVATLILDRKECPSLPRIYYFIGGCIFILAQFLTISLLLPILSLGAVSNA